MERFRAFAQTPVGLVVVLAVAAWLEAYGDSCLRDGLYNSKGWLRVGWFAGGAVVLFGYGIFLNSSNIDFGRLLGLYVTLFFVMAQVIAFVRFGERPGAGTMVGGSCIVIGGLIMLIRW